MPVDLLAESAQSQPVDLLAGSQPPAQLSAPSAPIAPVDLLANHPAKPLIDPGILQLAPQMEGDLSAPPAPQTTAYNVGAGFARTVGHIPSDLTGVVAPKTAAAWREKTDEMYIPDPGIATTTGEVLGGAAKLLPAMAAPLIAIPLYAGEGAGGKRVDIAQRRAAGEQISGGAEALSAAGTGAINVGAQLAGGKIAGVVGKGIGQAIGQSSVGPLLAAGARAMTAGAGVGAGAQVAENAIDKATIDPNRPLMQGTARAAGMGALQDLLAGGIAGLAGHGATERPPEEPPPAAVEPKPQGPIDLLTGSTPDNSAIPEQKTTVARAGAIEKAGDQTIPPPPQNAEPVAPASGDTAQPIETQRRAAQEPVARAVEPQPAPQAPETIPEPQVPSPAVQPVAPPRSAAIEPVADAEIPARERSTGETPMQDEPILSPEEKAALAAPLETELAKPTIGAGPAHIDDPAFTKPNEGPTSTKNRIVDQERASRGLPAAMEEARRELGGVWDKAMKEVDENPRAQDDLIDSLKDRPRAVTDRENALLLHRQIELQNEYKNVTDNIIKAQASGDDAALAENNARWSVLSDKLLEHYDVLKSAGRETGRGLNARRMMAAEDYSRAAMETAKRAANKGRPLTPAEHAQMTDLHNKLAAKQRELDEHIKNTDERIRRLKSHRATRAIVKEVDAETIADKIKGKVRDIRAEKDAILKGLRDRVAGGAETSDVGNYIQKLARKFVAEGVRERDPLVKAVHGAIKDIVPGITDRQTMDAISGYGDFKNLSKDEVSVKLRDLKGQMQQVAKLADMTEKNQSPLKTGVERRIPSDEERRLIQQVNETKRRLNIQTTDPATQLKSALDGVKTRLKNQISDLEHQIATGEKIVKEKGVAPSDDESKALADRRDVLKQQFDDIFGNPGMSDEQRVKMAMAAAEKSAAEYERRIKEGDLFPGRPKGKTLTTPELLAVRARRDALREQVKELQSLANPPKSAESIREKQLQKAIANLSAKIEAGDFATNTGQKLGPDTERVAWLTKQRDTLNQHLAEARKAANPPKTPEQIALQSMKTRLASNIADLAEKIAGEDYSKTPREPITLDNEALRLKAENERLRVMFRQELMKDRLRQRPLAEKAADAFVKYNRMGLLSSPKTLVKLASAAFERTAIAPAEEAVGGAISKVFPGVASRAPIQGGFNIKAEAKAITEGYVKGISDAARYIQTGKTDLDFAFGKQDVMPQSWMDFAGKVHGALKTVPKRAAFVRAFEKGTRWAMANGFDVTDPAVQTRIAVESYKEANRSIFMQDNLLATKVSMFLSKVTDKATGQNTGASVALHTAGKVMMPIVKIPANIVAETMTYATGTMTGGARLARAYGKGIENLRPEEADVIMRHLKKGSVGAAILAIGFFNPRNVGGYYEPGKRDKKDVQFGGVRVYGVEVPRALVHNPALEMLQFGATIRRVADSYEHGEKRGLGAGVEAAAFGVAEELPFSRSITDSAKLLDPKQRDAAGAELIADRIVPQGAQDVAEWLDTDANGQPIKRKATGIPQHFESKIPFVRKNLPVKPARP